MAKAKKDLAKLAKKAIAGLYDWEKPIFTRVKERMETLYESQVIAHWELGKAIVEGQAEAAALVAAGKIDAEDGGPRRLVKRLQKALGLDSRTMLDNSKTAAVLWPKRQDLQVYLDMRGPNGERLSWSHMTAIALENMEPKRQQILQAALDEGLSAHALRTRLMGMDSVRRGVGRNIKPPTSAYGCLARMRSQMEHLISSFDQAYLLDHGDDEELPDTVFNLSRSLETLSPAEVDAAFKALYTSTSATLHELETRTVQAQALLARMEPRVEALLTGKLVGSEPAAEEMQPCDETWNGIGELADEGDTEAEKQLDAEARTHNIDPDLYDTWAAVGAIVDELEEGESLQDRNRRRAAADSKKSRKKATA